MKDAVTYKDKHVSYGEMRPNSVSSGSGAVRMNLFTWVVKSLLRKVRGK